MPQAYDEFVAGAMADADGDDGARRGEVGSLLPTAQDLVPFMQGAVVDGSVPRPQDRWA